MNLSKPKFQLYFFLSLCLLWLAISFSPFNKPQVYNLTTGEIAPQFKGTLPLLRYVGEPFIGLVEYFVTFKNLRTQLISWFIWIIGLFIFFSVLKFLRTNRIKWRVWILNLVLVINIFILWILYVLFFPLPGTKLISSQPDWYLIDPHSHTFYSHDGVKSVKDTLTWHQNRGYQLNVITDHQNVESWKDINQPGVVSDKIISIPGIETEREDVHLLIFGINDWGRIRNISELKDFVTTVHQQNGTVIVAEYWHNPGQPLSTLITAGVDGFELINSGHPDIPAKIHAELVRIAHEKNLPLWASTNWHGWGSFTYLWTAVHFPQLNTGIINKSNLLSIPFNKLTYPDVIPLFYGQKQVYHSLRIIGEPICGLYYYFTGLNFFQTLSWIFWICLFYRLRKFIRKHRKRLLGIVLCITGMYLILFSFIYYKIYPSPSTNKICTQLILVFRVTGILTLFSAVRFVFR